MLTAVVVGGLGIYAMLALGLLGADDLHIKSAQLLTNALGGVVFGIGMAVLGYCPGTGVGAIGDGGRDAIFGVVGMVVGAAIYAEVHSSISDSLGDVGALGKATLASQSGLSPWWFVVLLVILAVGIFVALERWEARRKT